MVKEKTASKKSATKTVAKKTASKKTTEKKSTTKKVAPKKTAEKKSKTTAKEKTSAKKKLAPKVSKTKVYTKTESKKSAEKKVPAKKTKIEKFRIGQKIVYPSQGVGKIIEIKEQLFQDKKLLYYKIYIEASDMMVMVPVEKATELGIRSIVSANEANKALKLLSEDFEPITSDWKLRYQMNLDLLKKGTIADIATIVRCLYNRSKIKELPILERKLYDSARKLLEDEVSFAISKPAKDVEAMIHTKLEPPGSVAKTKHVINLDDDEDDNLMDDMRGNDSSSSDESYDEEDF